jgi:hypothetical protein
MTYATGLDLTSFSSGLGSSAFAIDSRASSDGSVDLRLRVRLSADDLRWESQTSHDLLSWSAAPMTHVRTTAELDGTAILVFRVYPPTEPAGGSTFWRLRFVLATNSPNP